MCGGQQQVEGTFVNFCQAIQITNYIKLHSKHQGLEMAPRGFQHKSLKAIWQIDAFQGKRHRPFDLRRYTSNHHSDFETHQKPIRSHFLSHKTHNFLNLWKICICFLSHQDLKKIGTTHQFGARTVKLWRPLGKSTPIRLWQKPSLARLVMTSAPNRRTFRGLLELLIWWPFVRKYVVVTQISSSGIFRWYVTSLTYYQAEVYPFDSV